MTMLCALVDKNIPVVDNSIQGAGLSRQECPRVVKRIHEAFKRIDI